MAKLPTTAMEALLKKAGAKRVSESAKEELDALLVKRAESISKKAISFASHARRSTVKKNDILLAAETKA